MTRFAIIESFTGYVWGVVDAEDAVAACRALDLEVRPADYPSLTYEEGSRFDGRDGYLVHEAPAGFEVFDGQDKAEIEAVAALPQAAFVVVSNGPTCGD